MTGILSHVAGKAAILTILLTLYIPTIISDDTVPIPTDKSQVNNWYNKNVKPYSVRKDTLDPALVTAEGSVKVIKVKKDGTGNFKTVTDAVNSIPVGNTNRVIVWIGGGTYKEKISVERTKPFVTFYGAPNDVPTLVFDGTAAQFGTVFSASLTVESDYFSAVNVVIANSAPRPDGKMVGAQAVALRISGNKAAFYNCKIIGFQDTLCDDKGYHFFKDCYIEGTVDFIFGSGKSLYLNTELHVVPGDPVAMITAQARASGSEANGYSFVHCTVTGTGKSAFLGRAWRAFSRVVFAYTEMSDVVHPQGWSDNFHPENDKSVFYGEYKCMGPGSATNGRIGFGKQLSDADVNPFITLSFIEGSKWLLPPATV